MPCVRRTSIAVPRAPAGDRAGELRHAVRVRLLHPQLTGDLARHLSLLYGVLLLLLLSRGHLYARQYRKTILSNLRLLLSAGQHRIRCRARGNRHGLTGLTGLTAMPWKPITIPVKKPDNATTDSESTPMVLIWKMIRLSLAGRRNASLIDDRRKLNIFPMPAMRTIVSWPRRPRNAIISVNTETK